MVYQKTSPLCPYKGKGNNKCSHKSCPKVCIYLKHPEKCGSYQDWLELKELDDYNEKIDSDTVETPENTIGDSTNG